MTAHNLNTVLQIACITLLGVVCILLIKYARTGLNTWAGIGLTACVVCYLIFETPYIQSQRMLFYIALTGSISIPRIISKISKWHQCFLRLMFPALFLRHRNNGSVYRRINATWKFHLS